MALRHPLLAVPDELHFDAFSFFHFAYPRAWANQISDKQKVARSVGVSKGSEDCLNRIRKEAQWGQAERWYNKLILGDVIELSLNKMSSTFQLSKYWGWSRHCG
jgi:hypothetical protein